MGKIKQTTVEVRQVRKVFETTDGKQFNSKPTADAHQYQLDHEIIDVYVPTEIKLRDFVAWAEALLAEHGSKAMFVQNYSCMDTEFQIIKKR